MTIREELSDDFMSLAGEQLAAVMRLVEQLDDDKLDNQLRFERYEREWRRQEAAKRTAAINISDEEHSSEQTSDKAGTEERQATEDKSKMGLGRIRNIVLAWRDRTKRMVEESLVQWWSKWAMQAPELQLLRANEENR